MEISKLFVLYANAKSKSTAKRFALHANANGNWQMAIAKLSAFAVKLIAFDHSFTFCK